MDPWTRRVRLRADLDGHLAHLFRDVDGLLDALAARRLVARPVVPAAVRWRVVPLDLRGVDWSHEREWRLRGDLAFELDEATVVLDDDRAFARLAREAGGALGDLGVSLLAPR